MISSRIRSAHRFIERLQDHRRYGIHRDDLVLDMGSGQDPHPRANILSDKYLADASERSCGAGLLIDRPFVLTDATATPFPDKSFDFVFCSHLLEHMEDPAALLSELMRIGRRGFIETPSKIYEKLSGWDFHHWFVSVENDILIVERKATAVFDEDLHAWFRRRLDDARFSNFMIPRLNRYELLTTYVWENHIPYEIRDPFVRPASGVSGATSVDIQDVNGSMTISQKVKASLARAQRRISDKQVPPVLKALQCPVCGSTLVLGESCRTCTGCQMLYPISRNVHVALPELASPVARK